MHVFKVAFDLRGNQKNNKQTKTNNKPNKQTKVLHSGKTERCAWELSWFSSNAAQRWHTSIPGSTFSPTSALSRDRNQKLLIWKETSRIPEWWEWSVGPTLHTRRVVDQTHLGRSFLSHRREKGRKEGRKVRPVLWDDVCRCYYSLNEKKRSWHKFDRIHSHLWQGQQGLVSGLDVRCLSEWWNTELKNVQKCWAEARFQLDEHVSSRQENNSR